MTITINHRDFTIPQLNTKSWKDGVSWLKYITDKSPRTKPVRSIILHTHEGLKSTLIQGIGAPSSTAQALARYQVNTDREVSWDYTIDSDGTVYAQNDPAVDYCWQAGSINPVSLGIELVQFNNNGTRSLYSGQLKQAVLFIDFLTAALGIQRQIPWDKQRDKAVLTQIPRIQSNKSFYGILGHVQLTKDRGQGDPGEHIFNALRDAGYELFDISMDEDTETWKRRQSVLNIQSPDGIPGAETVRKLKDSGMKNGMWVQRPMDQHFSF
jgi:hypothetical protein